MGARTHRAGEIDELVELAYQSALTRAPFAALLPALARAIGADTAFIALWAPELDAGEIAINHATPDELIRAYRDHFWKIDLWRLAIERRNVPVGRAVSGTMLLPYRELQRSEMYNEALRPFDLHDTCCGRLHAGGSAGAAVSLLRARPKPVFARRDVACLGAVLPHMSRAFALHRRLGGLIGQREALASAIDRLAKGALLCDRRGRVVHATAAAAALLAAGDALFVERGRLRARDPAAERGLARLFDTGTTLEAWCESRIEIAARRANGHAPLRLTVVPARFGPLLASEEGVACYVLIDGARDTPHETVDVIGSKFGLTPAERRLLGRFMAGDSLGEAAEALGISPNTARFQMKQILHKTGTRRQLDLLRLCLGLNLRHDEGGAAKP